ELGSRVSLAVVPNASHALIPEQPALVVDAIAAWLRPLRRSMTGRSRHRPCPQGIQPDVPVPHYPNTWTHTPSQPLLRRPITRTEATGPMDLARKLQCGDDNLAVVARGGMAQGALIHVRG